MSTKYGTLDANASTTHEHFPDHINQKIEIWEVGFFDIAKNDDAPWQSFWCWKCVEFIHEVLWF